jgi:hypothetical protein
MPVMIAWTGVGQRARQGVLAVVAAAADCVGQPARLQRWRSVHLRIANVAPQIRPSLD